MHIIDSVTTDDDARRNYDDYYHNSVVVRTLALADKICHLILKSYFYRAI
jgi:hypothetical protein